MCDLKLLLCCSFILWLIIFPTAYLKWPVRNSEDKDDLVWTRERRNGITTFLTMMISSIRYELLRGSWELQLGRCWRKYKDYMDNTTNHVSFISLVKSLRYLSSFLLQSLNQIYNFLFKEQLDLLPQIFGSDPSCANYLKVLIESLFSHTACLLTKIQVQSVAWFCILLLVT